MAAAAPSFRAGHELRLLKGATEFVPALVAAIDAAHLEVRLETYIFDFQGNSIEVAYALERAARRGVSVKVVVDGFGTAPMPPAWNERFLEAGVDWRVFSPPGRLGMLWPGNWRRMHRKLALVDGSVAFCGGINILDDAYDQLGPTNLPPRLDFSVQVTGPLVTQVAITMARLWMRMQAMQQIRGARLTGALQSLRAWAQAPVSTLRTTPQHEANAARAVLVVRDNFRNRSGIERSYRRAIGRARDEIIIANAYFVPGAKMRRALVAAAKRGVKVSLLLQGRYEYFMQYYASRPVYEALLAAGVEVYEYSASFLHAKVAVIDGHWATVGSSNLDPLSLLLAREANVMVEDEAFAQRLAERLRTAMVEEGRAMNVEEYENRSLHQKIMERFALGIMRLLLMIQGKKYL